MTPAAKYTSKSGLDILECKGWGMVSLSTMVVSTSSKTPLVSIIAPVYGVEDYLDACVNSIVNQSYEHLEIILIDDGSPDACGELCDRWASRDSRIVSVHKENGGLSDARNYGLDRAHGEYIVCVDSDDVIEPTLVERSLDAALSHNAALVLYRFLYLNNDGKTQEDNPIAPFPAGQLCDPEKAFAYFWKGCFQNFSWSMLAERSCYEGVRFPKGRLMEDMATTYRLIQNSARIYFLDEPLYLYRVREGSILDHVNEHVCRDMLRSIQDMNYFADARYPALKNLERNWALRTAFMDATWAYGLKGKIDSKVYSQLWNSVTGQIKSDARTLGWKQMDCRNKIKMIFICAGLMPLFMRISRARSNRK